MRRSRRPINTSSSDIYRTNLQHIKDVLLKTHGFPLSTDDLSGIEEVYYAFYWYGPSISHTVGRRYADLLIAVDYAGGERSFLATEEAFKFGKSMHARNLIVPVVADMAGPKALRTVGAYLRQRQAPVRSFYVAGVPASLARMGLLPAFCVNLATMPIDRDSVLLRPDPAEPGMGKEPTPNMTAEWMAVMGIAGATRVLFAMNQPAADWAAAAVVPIVEELKRCQ